MVDVPLLYIPHIIVLRLEIDVLVCGSRHLFNSHCENSCLCNGSLRGFHFVRKVLRRNVFTEGLSESI